MATELKEGEYIIPEGMTLVINGSSVVIRTIRDRHRKPDDYRCIDCKNIADGHWTNNQWWHSNVCLKQPKKNKKGLFYAVTPLGGKNCSLFEKK